MAETLGWPSPELKEHSAESIFNFCIRKARCDPPWAFRGEARDFKTQKPSLTRGRETMTVQEEVERLRAFMRAALEHADPSEARMLAWDRQRHGYSIAAAHVLQHFGGHTRLVDWSHSPFMAAFVASCDEPNEPGYIWCVRHAAVQACARRMWTEVDVPWITTPKARTVDLDALVDRGPLPWMTAWYPASGIDRAHRQFGLFMVAGDSGACHRKLLQSNLEDNDRLCLEVSTGVKQELVRLLRLAGTTARSLGIPKLDHWASKCSSEPLDSLKRSIYPSIFK